jgi:hypothetical protein
MVLGLSAICFECISLSRPLDANDRNRVSLNRDIDVAKPVSFCSFFSVSNLSLQMRVQLVPATKDRPVPGDKDE